MQSGRLALPSAVITLRSAWLLVLKKLSPHDQLAFGLTCKAFLEAVTATASPKWKKKALPLRTDLRRETLFEEMPSFSMGWFQWVASQGNPLDIKGVNFGVSRRRSSRRRSRSPDVGAMGKLFRDASRGVRYAYIGKTTVKAGESALLFTLGGKSRVVEGPRRLRVFCTTIRFLDRFVANTHEYLRIQMRSGEISHMRGPCTMYLNPCVHESVDVLSAEKLADKEAIVVYSSDSAKASTVSRRVVVGPQLFVPDPHEWLHEFAWTSGAAEAGMEESRTVVSLRREVLRASVQSAQTASGDSVSLDLELTYQLDASAVAVVLDQTCDPVAELSAALKSDALAACKSMCVKDAVGATNPLGNLDIYKQTKALAAQLGFSLQGLRCSASDTASAKTEAEARKANAAIEHSRRMAEQRLAEEEIKLQSETRSSEQRRELRRKEHEFEMSITKQRTDQEIEKLTKLRELGVDLTAFLTAQRGECISNTARRMHKQHGEENA